MLTKRYLLIILLISVLSPFLNYIGAQTNVIISEFQAINNETIQDSNGNFSDWIEIYNSSDQSINLLGWSLTDDKANLKKWIFPDTTIAPKNYILVFASGNNIALPGKELHTGFRLSGSGEYLALIGSDNTIKTEFSPVYPFQQPDISYGILNGLYMFITTPTPGAANVSGNVVLPVVFSHKRGIHTTAFNLSLSTVQNGNTIYYTTDGTIPNKNTGQVYTSSIKISSTEVISAKAYNANGDSSSIVTNTYVFIESVLNQPNTIEGYPNVWGRAVNGQYLPADYAMDPDICNSTRYKADLIASFSDIPTISLVTTPGYIFSSDPGSKVGGIYIYTGNTYYGSYGFGWERPTSAEYFDPKTGLNFQVNCGILLHGGNSRIPENSQKHSFRLSFRNEYGPSKLKFNFFRDDRNPTSEFNSLVLRAGFNDSWIKNSTSQNKYADYLRDPFTKNTLLDMGHKGAHSRYVHLYINGIYWGIYNVSEKLTNDFMESYMNGDENDWDVVKDHSGIVDGRITEFNNMISFVRSGLSDNAQYQKLQGLNLDGTVNPEFPNYLDIDNFIDYMLINYYIGNKDWDGNNWIAARNRIETKHGFRFFVWDAETSMNSLYENITSLVDGKPTTLWNYLSENAEFKLRVADRMNKHFHNNGALTVDAIKTRYQELTDEINLAIIAESARWGDYRRDAMNDESALLYTKDDHWQVEVNKQLSSYFPQRSQIVFNQLKSKGFYPSIAAPTFSSYGETIETSIEFNITNPNSSGEIYYTSDGSDPRLFGGNTSSTAKIFNTTLTLIGKGKIKARIKNGDNWSALTTAKFKGDTTNFILGSYSIKDLNLSCYPNPANNFTTVNFKNECSDIINIKIISIDGKFLKSVFQEYCTKGNNSISINVSDISSGIYFIEVESNRKIERIKLVIRN